MKQVEYLCVSVSLYQFAFRENVIEMVVTGGCKILKTARIKGLYQIVTRSLHQRRPVRVLSRKHIREVNTQLGLAATLRHGNRQKVQFPFKYLLVCVYVPLKIVSAGLIKLLVQGLPVLHRLQVVIKEVWCAHQQGTEKQIVKSLRKQIVLCRNSRLQSVAVLPPQVMVPRMGYRKIFLLIFPAYIKQVIVRRKVKRLAFNGLFYVRFHLQIVHLATSFAKE